MFFKLVNYLEDMNFIFMRLIAELKDTIHFNTE